MGATLAAEQASGIAMRVGQACEALRQLATELALADQGEAYAVLRLRDRLFELRAVRAACEMRRPADGTADPGH